MRVPGQPYAAAASTGLQHKPGDDREVPINRFGSWTAGLIAKAEAGQDVTSELLKGAQLVEQTDRHGSTAYERILRVIGISPDESFIVEDLIDGTTYTWRGAWNYIRLDPAERMAHIFVIRHP